MGIKHLIKIENLMKNKGWFSKTEIRDSIQMDMYKLQDTLQYFVKKGIISTKKDEKGIKRYRWK